MLDVVGVLAGHDGPDAAPVVGPEPGGLHGDVGLAALAGAAPVEQEVLGRVELLPGDGVLAELRESQPLRLAVARVPEGRPHHLAVPPPPHDVVLAAPIRQPVPRRVDVVQLHRRLRRLALVLGPRDHRRLPWHFPVPSLALREVRRRDVRKRRVFLLIAIIVVTVIVTA